MTGMLCFAAGLVCGVTLGLLMAAALMSGHNHEPQP